MTSGPKGCKKHDVAHFIDVQNRQISEIDTSSQVHDYIIINNTAQHDYGNNDMFEA